MKHPFSVIRLLTIRGRAKRSLEKNLLLYRRTLALNKLFIPIEQSPAKEECSQLPRTWKMKVRGIGTVGPSIDAVCQVVS